jgi:two-component system, NarL family, invasion response regulator UvrY
MSLTLMIVDDHSVVREGYRRLLERDPELLIVAEADSADSAYRSFCETRPQVVVLDIALPGASGFEAMRRMLVRDSDARILICSMYDDPIYIERSFGFGATGYVTKTFASDVLLDAIKSVAKGERFLSADAASALSSWQERERTSLASLSARELEVLRQLAGGATIPEAGRALKLSEKTISNYQTLIRQKLGARNMAQLLMIAARLGPPRAEE